MITVPSDHTPMERTLINPETDQIAPLPVTATESSGADVATTPEIASNTNSFSIAEGSGGVPEIDELLVEILGENYRDDTKSEQQQDKRSDSEVAPKIKYITGSKELDELVEAILGKGWEKDDGMPVARKIAPEYSQKELDELIELILGKDWDTDEEPVSMLFDSETTHPVPAPEIQDSSSELDSIVESILSGSKAKNNVQLVTTKPDKDRDFTHSSKTSKTESKSDAPSSIGTAKIRSTTPLPGTKRFTDYQSINIDQEGNNTHSVIIGFLILTVLISAAGSWKYITSTDDTTRKNVELIAGKKYPTASQEDITSQAVTTDYSTAIEYSNPIVPSITTTLPVSQIPSLNEQKESFIPNSEGEFSDSEYATTEQNTTTLPNENAANYDMDNNTDIPAEPVTDDNMFTIILPVEENVKSENDSKLSAGIENTKVKIDTKPPTREVIIYTVVPGDTFWSIAKRYVNNPYKYTELAEQNRVKDPDRIYPGNKIRIIKISK